MGEVDRMSRIFSRQGFVFFMAVSCGWVTGSARLASANDVINVDMSRVDPAAIKVIENAEAFWEARIRGYTTELPRHLSDQLTALTIGATVAPIDGPGGILGYAGPDTMLSYSRTDPITGVERTYVVALSSSMTFDIDDFPDMEAMGILQSVVNHEMGHALGIGSLWQQNGLVAEVIEGEPLMEYVGGKYAIAGFGIDIGNPFVQLVPVEQRGGPGTALGHWTDLPPFFNQAFTPAFKKEVMTGFACDGDPITQELVCPKKFTSNATWGTLADLGFAVQGFNEQYIAARGKGTGRWPKTTGANIDPFEYNGIPPEGGIRFHAASSYMVTKLSLGSEGKGVSGDESDDATFDPYNLRQHRWVKPGK